MPGTPTPALWPNPASSILIVAGNHPDCRAIKFIAEQRALMEAEVTGVPLYHPAKAE
jgi:hypothetical protein